MNAMFNLVFILNKDITDEKMTMTEASVIVGGTCTSVNTFELTLVGDETVCNAVNTSLTRTVL